METALKNARDSTPKTASGGDIQRFPALKRIDERQDNQGNRLWKITMRFLCHSEKFENATKRRYTKLGDNYPNTNEEGEPE